MDNPDTSGNSRPVARTMDKLNLHCFPENFKCTISRLTQISRENLDGRITRCNLGRGILEIASVNQTMLAAGAFATDQMTLGMILSSSEPIIANGIPAGELTFSIVAAMLTSSTDRHITATGCCRCSATGSIRMLGLTRLPKHCECYKPD